MIGGLLSGIAASPWVRAALRYGVILFAVFLFLLSFRRSGERAGRLAERVKISEKANDVQRQMLEAAARRSRQKFNRYQVGFFHIDIAEVQTAEGKLHLFVGID